MCERRLVWRLRPRVMREAMMTELADRMATKIKAALEAKDVGDLHDAAAATGPIVVIKHEGVWYVIEVHTIKAGSV